jgi:hypothetical protein
MLCADTDRNKINAALKFCYFSSHSYRFLISALLIETFTSDGEKYFLPCSEGLPVFNESLNFTDAAGQRVRRNNNGQAAQQRQTPGHGGRRQGELQP